MLGVFGGKPGGNTNVLPKNSNSNSQVPPPIKSELVKIQGGKFTMGRNGGDPLQSPEHEAEVKDFWMDKTEVSNAEYYAFVEDAKYNPLPLNWENGKPLTAEMVLPVRYVNFDDIKAFADWRSKRDKVNYRLPSEEEWEFAARNGSDDNLYPWGDEFDENKAGVRRDLNFAPVGSKPEGANKLGILDLIGNVWEWTSTPASAYTGSPLAKEVEERVGKTHLVVRGGFDQNKGVSTGTSTYRVFKLARDRDKAIGFRLVRSD